MTFRKPRSRTCARAAAALEHVRERGFRKVTQASITDIPFRSETFDLVFSFEVVTQTPYDVHDGVLGELHRVLKPGGYLFIRVPAFMWLWSSHDDELQVRYRYKRDELARRLERAGFTVEWASYANGFLFPVILLRRFLKRIAIQPAESARQRFQEHPRARGRVV